MLRRIAGARALIAAAVISIAAGAIVAGWMARPRGGLDEEGSLAWGRFMELAAGARWIGPEDAAVVVLVYSDYACGFCAILQDSLSALRDRYPQHVAIAIKHFVAPSALPGFRVPLGAECAAEQGMFDDYHDAAFANARVLGYTAGWRLVAEAAKIRNMAAFENCVRSARHATRIADQYEEGRRLGIRGTPTLFVNGRRIVGAPPLAVLDSLAAAGFPGRRAR